MDFVITKADLARVWLNLQTSPLYSQKNFSFFLQILKTQTTTKTHTKIKAAKKYAFKLNFHQKFCIYFR